MMLFLMFVQARKELVYFTSSRARSPKTAVIPGLYLIAFVDLVPIAYKQLICIMQRVHFQIRVGGFNCQGKDFVSVILW